MVTTTMADLENMAPGKCEAINEGNALRCRKDAVGAFDNKGYCTTHLKRSRQHHAQQLLELPCMQGRSEQFISSGHPWLAVIFDDSFIPELGLYQVFIVAQGDLQRRPTGTWPPRQGYPLPWLWGPDKATAERIADRFNEERGYTPQDIWRVLHSAGVTGYHTPKVGHGQMIVPTRGDLQRVDAISAFISLHGNNSHVYWRNLSYKRFSGVAGVGVSPAWGQTIHPEDVPLAYEAYARVLRSNEPYVIDVRILQQETMQYGWHRFTNQPIFLPDTSTFLFRSAVATPLHVNAVSYRSLTLDTFHFESDKVQHQLSEIILDRFHCHAEQQHLMQQRHAVAFVPHQEKQPYYGYQLALATPSKTGYTRVGDLPYLPTPNYYPPIFLGSNYEAAQAVADKFNAHRNIDREMAMSILQHSKCLAL